MSAELYHNRVLELAANIPNVGRLEDADASVEKVSRVCGSVVRVDIRLSEDGETVEAVAVDPKACALGQAAAGCAAGAGCWGDWPTVAACPAHATPIAVARRSTVASQVLRLATMTSPSFGSEPIPTRGANSPTRPDTGAQNMRRGLINHLAYPVIRSPASDRCPAS